MPLLYGLWRDEVIVAASNGGADDHPAWFLNLQAMGEQRFQIAVDVFRGSWRQLGGEERATVWDYLVGLYPPYADYQRATPRETPLIALTRAERVAAL